MAEILLAGTFSIEKPHCTKIVLSIGDLPQPGSVLSKKSPEILHP
jgi:hypothetical protein